MNDIYLVNCLTEWKLSGFCKIQRSAVFRTARGGGDSPSFSATWNPLTFSHFVFEDDTEYCPFYTIMYPKSSLIFFTFIYTVVNFNILQSWKEFLLSNCMTGADLSGRAVECEGLRPIACWNCGFESRRGLGYLSLVCVVFCQTEVPAMGRFLPTVLCHCKWPRNLKNEAVLASVGLLRQRKKNCVTDVLKLHVNKVLLG